MALDIWTIKSGYSFGTIEERTIVNIELPVSSSTGITFSVISGQLPAGLRISNNYIVGTPFTVPRLTKFTFCIRATNGIDVSDRTFTLSINNTEVPVFVTPAGDLPVGPNQQLFALANTYIDFQIEVTDLSVAAGKRLEFFIADSDGILPPGLILTDTGRIVGFVQPVLSIKKSDGNGTYDTGPYDNVAYDFGFRSTNGYDSYIFDSVFYDFNIPTNPPRQLNRSYRFYVTVSDGDNIAKREFDIFVVGDDYFRATNNNLLDGSGLFTADATYLIAPIWLTPSNLGSIRADNYKIIPINIYDNNNVFCSAEVVNADILASTLKVSTYDNVNGSIYLTINHVTSIPLVGQYLTFDSLFVGATSSLHQIIDIEIINSSTYRLILDNTLEATVPDNVRFTIGALSQFPPGLSFDENSNEIYGFIPYQPAITTHYEFTLVAKRYSSYSTEIARSWRKFTVNLIGEIESLITWNTDPDLGDIAANYISTLRIYAIPAITNGVIVYTLIDGQLPPGLTLNTDGEILGKVDQYALTRFDFTLDNNTTSIDRDFTFTIKATTLFGYGETTRTFTLTVTTPDEVAYSNIKVKPYLKLEQRTLWRDFIDNPNVFNPASIYRSNDSNFGVQKSLSMLIYAGIETVEAAAYVGAIGLNHKKKKFIFNGVKKAIAYTPGTKNSVYEVVYMDMIDPLETNGKHLSSKLKKISKDPNTITIDESVSIWSRSLDDLSLSAPDATRPGLMITVDSTGYQGSDPNIISYYPSSITNWRGRIKGVGQSERNFLPLWMRSIQPGSKQELNYQLAVPICYCKPGTADEIILNIKYSGFDFAQIDYTVDRYIIDAVEGSAVDKYLVFRNDRITV